MKLSANIDCSAAGMPVAHHDSSDLTYEDFVRQFVGTRTPVVVHRAFDQWPAMHKWTPSYFKQRFGDRLINVSYREKLSFSEFIDKAEASTVERPGPYLYRLFMHEHLPEALPDIAPQCRYSFPRRYASPLMPKYWRRPDGYQKLLIGGLGGKFPVMHFDSENAHATISEVYGEKEFILYAPTDSPFMYPSPLQPNHSMIQDPNQPDVESFPLFARATRYSAVLRPGDMVFVPCGWWHTARALNMSISVGMNILDTSNWDGFVSEVTVGVGWRPALKRTYFSGLGAALGMIERMQERGSALANTLAPLAPASAAVAPDPALHPVNIEMPTL